MRPELAAAAGIELGVTARWCLRLYRLGRWCCRHHLGPVGRLVQLFNRIVTGADIDLAANVSADAIIPHTIGVVIGATSIVESGVVLMPHVVLGAKTHVAEGRRHPHICQGAVIGAGAVLLGPIVVGARAKVGANAVVVNDVAEGQTVIGIPARLVEPSEKVGT